MEVTTSRPCLGSGYFWACGNRVLGGLRDGGGCRTSPAVDVRRPGFVSTGIHLSDIKQISFLSGPVTSPGIQIRPQEV